MINTWLCSPSISLCTHEKQERQYIELFNTYSNHVLTAVSVVQSRAQWRLFVMDVRIPPLTTALEIELLQAVHVISSDSMALMAQIPL